MTDERTNARPLKIESASNDTFRMFSSLTISKGLKKEGLFILSGEKIIHEFLKKPNLKIAYELVTEKLSPLTSAKITLLSQELFNELDVVGTHFNLLVLEQPKIEKLEALTKPKGFEVVLPVGDPSNLGALLRSCEAFGVDKVILTAEAANPFLPKAVKASAGSILRLQLFKGPALFEIPSDCIALESGGIPLSDFKWPKDCRLVVGEEGPGLKNLKYETKISIPTLGVESLNAVVAASIALYSRKS